MWFPCWDYNRLIFIMEILVPGRTVFILGYGPEGICADGNFFRLIKRWHSTPCEISWESNATHEMRSCSSLRYASIYICHGPLAKYEKFRVAHVPGMPGMFSPPPRVSDPDMNQGTCVTHVPWCISGSLTCGFLWSRWRGKRSRYSRRLPKP